MKFYNDPRGLFLFLFFCFLSLFHSLTLFLIIFLLMTREQRTTNKNIELTKPNKYTATNDKCRNIACQFNKALLQQHFYTMASSLRLPFQVTSRLLVLGEGGGGRTKTLHVYCPQRRYKSTKVPPSESSAALGVDAAGSKPLVVQLWNSYTNSLQTNPLRTKMTAAALIFFTSDSVTQHMMDPEEPWDFSRASSGAVFGAVATCYLHVWWNFLERSLERLIPVARSRLANTAAKVSECVQ